MPELAEDLFRTQSGQVLGALMRRFGTLDLAEDAYQDACLAALETWPRTGVPDNPAAWLTTVARNRALDRIRRESLRVPKEAESLGLRFGGSTPLTSPAADEEVIDLDAPLEDDALRLLFLCCHPALNTGAQIALTLRTVGGLTTPEIARAFLVPESTMAQRLVRAKRKIALAGIPFRLPDPGEEMAERTATVLHVVYLIFNEGYAATEGDELVRNDLCTEAVRLATLLERLLPDDAEVTGLLALLILHDARRLSRTDAEGRLVPLDEQDRSSWDRAQIERGVALVERSLARGPVGPYQVQAAIAAIHAEAEAAVLTDWDEVVALYTLLEQLAPGPLVSLNRAVAISMRDGPEAGLAALDALDPAAQPEGSHRLAAARAHLLERLDRLPEARAEYARAAERADTRPERDYLRERLARLG